LDPDPNPNGLIGFGFGFGSFKTFGSFRIRIHNTAGGVLTYDDGLSEGAVSRLAQRQQESLEEGTGLEQGFPAHQTTHE